MNNNFFKTINLSLLLRFNCSKKINFVLLLVIGTLYFLQFIPLNLTGSSDGNMLAVRYIDESALFNGIRDFKGWKHWDYYGYPYFLQTVPILRILNAYIIKLDDPNFVKTYMVIIRQLDVLWIILAIMVIIKITTNYRNAILSFFLFIFLGFIPGIYRYNLIFHADGLFTFFAMLSLYGLWRDHFKMKKWFFLSAVAAGFCIGTKLNGVFLAFPVFSYIVIYAINKYSFSSKLVKVAFFFFILTILSYFIINPLLVVPENFVDYYKNYLSLQISLFVVGEDYGKVPNDIISLWLFPVDNRSITTCNDLLDCLIRNISLGYFEYYGGFIITTVLIISCIVILCSKSKLKSMYIIVLSWSIPLGYYYLTRIAFYWAFYYFIPLLLPLYAISIVGIYQIAKKVNKRFITMSFTIIILVQAIIFIRTDYTIYQYYANFESQNQGISFFKGFEAQLIKFKLPKLNTPLIVFRDPHTYVPANDSRFNVYFCWCDTNYEVAMKNSPDILLLENQLIKNCSKDEPCRSLSGSLSVFKKTRLFYQDAYDNKIVGFRKIYSDEFGNVYISNKY